MCVRGYRCVCKGIVSVFSDPLLSTQVWAANFRQILTLDLGEVSVLSEYRQALEAKEICVLVARCPYKHTEWNGVSWPMCDLQTSQANCFRLNFGFFSFCFLSFFLRCLPT